MKIAVDSSRALWTAARSRRRFAAILAGISIGLLASCSRSRGPAHEGPPERIITLTPSLTEIVTALGGADLIIATDRYSIESGAIAGVPVVSDFLAPNVEAISKLRPHLVVLDTVQSKAAAVLERAGIETLSIDMHSIADVKSALTRVARAMGREDAGKNVVAAIDAKLAATPDAGPKPRVLWIIDRNPDRLINVVAAGPGTYADELLRSVGAINALVDERVRYPKLSAEAVMRLEVDLAIDASGTARQSMKAWEARPEIKAAAVEPSLAVPGPNVGAALETVRALVAGAPR